MKKLKGYIMSSEERARLLEEQNKLLKEQGPLVELIDKSKHRLFEVAKRLDEIYEKLN